MNQKHKRNFEKSLEEVMQTFVNREEIIQAMDETYEEITTLDFQIKRKL